MATAGQEQAPPATFCGCDADHTSTGGQCGGLERDVICLGVINKLLGLDPSSLGTWLVRRSWRNLSAGLTLDVGPC